MLDLEIHDETSQLEMVILGITTEYGTREVSINPKSNSHLENGTFPLEEELLKEIEEFEDTLLRNGVIVFRPQNIKDLNQIFTRDLGFVIDDVFISPRMGKKRGTKEIEGIEYLINLMHPNKIIRENDMPNDATIEGGDVVQYRNIVFVGKSNRTNDAGFNFIKAQFPNKEVIQIEIHISENPEENVLHLDCAFQPIGEDCAIIYEEGILDPDKIKVHFKPECIITVTKKQAYRMFPNVFSISPTKIVIEKRFFELKHKLLKRNFEVIEVNYAETSKLGGLLRCSTLPLRRKY